MTGDGDNTKSQSTRQQMIPAVGKVRASLMRYFHSPPAEGHPGVRKTVDSMKQMVFWKEMWSKVQSFIRACPCKRDLVSSIRLHPPPKSWTPTTIPLDTAHRFSRAETTTLEGPSTKLLPGVAVVWLGLAICRSWVRS